MTWPPPRPGTSVMASGRCCATPARRRAACLPHRTRTSGPVRTDRGRRRLAASTAAPDPGRFRRAWTHADRRALLHLGRPEPRRPQNRMGRTHVAPWVQPSQAEPPPPDLEIVSRVVSGSIVVAVTGEVDTEAAPTLRAAVMAAIDDTAGTCVLDLTTVDFLDSAGLATLITTDDYAKEQGKSLRVAVDSNSPVIRPIEITGLDIVLRLYHTVDEALAVSNRRPRPER
ncbi:STAS domain-containing protein [Amycolatopsis keratiniphila]|uniref:STAS domain-containing protein n=1 Tax=Amycolatopsis keratiniphila TaxID=129921 RepID=UPI0009F9C66D|nr:STAS domain-containing protein [Amycolatopsis keratiniphila]